MSHAQPEFSGQPLAPFFGAAPTGMHSQPGPQQGQFVGSGSSREDVSIAVRRWNTDGYFEDAEVVRGAASGVVAPGSAPTQRPRRRNEADRAVATQASIGRELVPFFGPGDDMTPAGPPAAPAPMQYAPQYAPQQARGYGVAPPPPPGQDRGPTGAGGGRATGGRHRERVEADRLRATRESVGRALVPFFADGAPDARGMDAGPDDYGHIPVRRWGNDGYFQDAEYVPVHADQGVAPPAVPAAAAPAGEQAPPAQAFMSMSADALFSMARASAAAAAAPAVPTAAAVAVATPPASSGLLTPDTSPVTGPQSTPKRGLLTPQLLLSKHRQRRSAPAGAAAAAAVASSVAAAVPAVVAPVAPVVAPVTDGLSALQGVEARLAHDEEQAFMADLQAQLQQHQGPTGGRAQYAAPAAVPSPRAQRRAPVRSLVPSQVASNMPQQHFQQRQQQRGSGGRGPKRSRSKPQRNSHSHGRSAPSSVPPQHSTRGQRQRSNSGNSGGGGAYAWSAFQNSPDPHALPVPSFDEDGDMFATSPPARPASYAAAAKGLPPAFITPVKVLKRPAPGAAHGGGGKGGVKVTGVAGTPGGSAKGRGKGGKGGKRRGKGQQRGSGQSPPQGAGVGGASSGEAAGAGADGGGVAGTGGTGGGKKSKRGRSKSKKQRAREQQGGGAPGVSRQGGGQAQAVAQEAPTPPQHHETIAEDLRRMLKLG